MKEFLFLQMIFLNIVNGAKLAMQLLMCLQK